MCGVLCVGRVSPFVQIPFDRSTGVFGCSSGGCSDSGHWAPVDGLRRGAPFKAAKKWRAPAPVCCLAAIGAIRQVASALSVSLPFLEFMLPFSKSGSAFSMLENAFGGARITVHCCNETTFEGVLAACVDSSGLLLENVTFIDGRRDGKLTLLMSCFISQKNIRYVEWPTCSLSLVQILRKRAKDASYALSRYCPLSKHIKKKICQQPHPREGN